MAGTVLHQVSKSILNLQAASGAECRSRAMVGNLTRAEAGTYEGQTEVGESIHMQCKQTWEV